MLPAFGGATDIEARPAEDALQALAPKNSLESREANLVVDADDELLPRREDDVHAQLEDFLAQLPEDERGDVVEQLLSRLAGGPREIDQAAATAGLTSLKDEISDREARIEESCEFLLRLLEFCNFAAGAEALLHKFRQKGKLAFDTGSPAAAPTDDSESATPQFLLTRREARLSPSGRTPFPLTATTAVRKCFGRGASLSMDAVAEAFRSNDVGADGIVERRVLTSLLEVAGGFETEKAEQLLQAAIGSANAVRYEDFLRWAFREEAEDG